jgi:hypothetical protein
VLMVDTWTDVVVVVVYRVPPLRLVIAMSRIFFHDKYL